MSVRPIQMLHVRVARTATKWQKVPIYRIHSQGCQNDTGVTETTTSGFHDNYVEDHRVLILRYNIYIYIYSNVQSV